MNKETRKDRSCRTTGSVTAVRIHMMFWSELVRLALEFLNSRDSRIAICGKGRRGIVITKGFHREHTLLT